MTSVLGSLAAADRDVQRAAVVHAIHQERLSRSDLITRLQISSSLVTRLVRSLIDDGILREIGSTASAAVGRPPVQLELVADYGHIAAISCEATRIRVGIYDQHGAEFRVNTLVLGGRQIDLALLMSTLDETWQSAGLSGRRMLGIAVSVPGIVDAQSGAVSEAPDLGWHETVALREILETAYAVPVTVDNDVNLLVTAERNTGLAVGVHDVAYLYLGHRGVGVGIVSGGQLIQGGHGAAGEIGIIPLRAGDSPEASVRIEDKISVVAIDAALQRCGLDTAPSPVTALVKWAAQGNADAVKIRAEVLGELMQSVYILSAILDPSIVLLGGAATDFSANDLAEMTERLAQHAPKPPTLAFAQLGTDALIVAAQAQCWRRILAGGL